MSFFFQSYIFYPWWGHFLIREIREKIALFPLKNGELTQKIQKKKKIITIFGQIGLAKNFFLRDEPHFSQFCCGWDAFFFCEIQEKNAFIFGSVSKKIIN